MNEKEDCTHVYAKEVNSPLFGRCVLRGHCVSGEQPGWRCAGCAKKTC